MITAICWIRIFQLFTFPVMSSLTTVAFAQDIIKVPYLFTDDQQLEQTELMEAMPKLNEIQGDQFLKAPMTRLDYILTKLESLVSDQAESVRETVSKGFQPNPMLHGAPFTIKSFARYARPYGRVLLGYEIEELGRPKISMRSTCDSVLSILERTAPQSQFGYLYHHTALGILYQDADGEKYTPSLNALARSFVYKAILQSRSDDGLASHMLICQRTGQDAPTKYQRYSFKIDGGSR